MRRAGLGHDQRRLRLGSLRRLGAGLRRLEKREKEAGFGFGAWGFKALEGLGSRV